MDLNSRAISPSKNPSKYPSYDCFYFLKPSKVIICTSYRIALIQSRLKGYLSLENYNYSNKKKKEVISQAYELEGLILGELEITNVIFPSKESSPIEGLPLELNSFSCTITNYNYITASKETIRKYIRNSY